MRPEALLAPAHLLLLLLLTRHTHTYAPSTRARSPKMAKEAGRTAPVRIRVAGGNEPAPAIAPGAAAGAGDVTGAGAEVGGTTASGNVPVTTTSAGGEGAGLESSAVPPTV